MVTLSMVTSTAEVLIGRLVVFSTGLSDVLVISTNAVVSIMLLSLPFVVTSVVESVVESPVTGVIWVVEGSDVVFGAVVVISKPVENSIGKVVDSGSVISIVEVACTVSGSVVSVASDDNVVSGSVVDGIGVVESESGSVVVSVSSVVEVK